MLLVATLLMYVKRLSYLDAMRERKTTWKMEISGIKEWGGARQNKVDPPHIHPPRPTALMAISDRPINIWVIVNQLLPSLLTVTVNCVGALVVTFNINKIQGQVVSLEIAQRILCCFCFICLASKLLCDWWSTLTSRKKEKETTFVSGKHETAICKLTLGKHKCKSEHEKRIISLFSS